MKKVMSVLALCGLLALSGGSAFAAQWKLAHIRPADSVIERDLQAFAKEVREATSGRIDIRIYGSSQLGDYTVVQEKVSLGSVEMSCESVSTQVDKRFLSYILPYVAKDYATAKKNFGTGTPYAKYCANLFDKQDIMVLANWPVYFGGIGLVKAPEAPADPNASHHIKVRVPTMKTQEALADGLGYQATPLPFAEFFTAAQTGMVSGIFGGGAENYYASFRDLLKCYIAANTHFENWPLLINKELFESQFPAQFISEAVDQTRGWFFSLHAESTLLFNKPCFENVIVLGHVQDENGQKMSKSKGNAVDPFNALETYGADAIRWYFYTSSAPWLPKRFSGKAVQEGQRKFMGTLWNTYAFFVLYANIDNFDASKYTLEYDKLPVMDKWLLSKLNSTVAEVDSNLDQYRIPEAAKALQDFVDEMSNWYVRRSRERFWAKGMEQDKINAYMTLYTALVTICKAAAPMIPFMTEDIYQNLVRSNDASAPESIHLCDFPVVNKDHIDKKLEEDMEDVLDAVVMGRACRNEAAIKNRQPISRMYIKADFTLSEFYQEIIEDELNVKEVVFTDDVRDFTSYTFKPQLRTVGPKYGKQLGGIQKHLAALDGNAAMDELNADGALKFDVDGVAVELTKDDLLIDMAQKEGYVSQEDNKMTVVLDTNLTPELVEEGFVYEIISKIQTMRKESGFEVTDHIRVSINGNDRLSEIARKNKDAISGKVLADELTSGAEYAVSKEWNINGENAVIAVERV